MDFVVKNAEKEKKNMEKNAFKLPIMMKIGKLYLEKKEKNIIMENILEKEVLEIYSN